MKKLKITALTLTIITMFSALFAISPCSASAAETGNAKYINSSSELAYLIDKASNGDYMILKRDLTLDRCINIKTSITIDLNGHTITTNSGDTGNKIICGGEIYDYYNEDQNCDIYRYIDELKVTFKSGIISGAKAPNGRDGEINGDLYWGEIGSSNDESIRLISGTIYLCDAKVLGSDGGDGGNGGYKVLSHLDWLVFNMPYYCQDHGDGGCGGNGGDGSYAIWVDRPEARLSLDNSSTISGGKGGEAGKGGTANPNYWVWSGKNGKDGRNGEDAIASNRMDKIIFASETK